MSIILFVGGGSLGHIVPSIAVWEALQDERKNLQMHFVCSTSALDTEYLKQQDLPFNTINAPRLRPSFVWKFWKAAAEAKKILKDVQPDLVFSTGGYVSVPICYVAKKQNIPIVLLNADVVVGRANRLVGDLATKICKGSPVRKCITAGNVEAGRTITGFTKDRPVLLVIGGSQGAQALNKIVIEKLDELLQQYQVIHITGPGKQLAQPKLGYYSTEFANEELPHFYAMADVAISRAGAGVTTELAANAIPTLLVPLRGVGHDHQQKNAEALSEGILFKVVQQLELYGKLIPTLQDIRENPISHIPYPISHASKIAKIVLEVLDSKQGPH